MKKFRISLSDTVIADILEQSEWYETQADRNLAKRWEEAVTGTLLRIAQSPGTGSPLISHPASLITVIAVMVSMLSIRVNLGAQFRRLRTKLGAPVAIKGSKNWEVFEFLGIRGVV